MTKRFALLSRAGKKPAGLASHVLSPRSISRLRRTMVGKGVRTFWTTMPSSLPSPRPNLQRCSQRSSNSRTSGTRLSRLAQMRSCSFRGARTSSRLIVSQTFSAKDQEPEKTGCVSLTSGKKRKAAQGSRLTSEREERGFSFRGP